MTLPIHLEAFQLADSQGPTTSRELWGWFSYSWASEPFIVSAVGTYVPILLEQFARGNAVRVDDRNVPCGLPLPSHPPSLNAVPYNNTVPPGLMPPPGDIHDPIQGQQCVVQVFGRFYIDTSSFALYTFSLSVLVQTLVVISMSGAADRGKFRKKLLVWFGVVGALSTCGFVGVTQTHYLVCAILAILSNSSFGAVSVCGNSFLPVIVRNHPEVLQVAEKIRGASGSEQDVDTDTNTNGNPRSSLDDPNSSSNNSNTIRGNSAEQNLAENERDQLLENGESEQFQNNSLYISITSKIASSISGKAVALGYISALIVQLATIFLIKSTGSSTWSLRCAVFVVGCWWLVFQIPIVLFLRSRPGPPLPAPKHLHSHKTLSHRLRRFLMTITNGGYAYIIYGWSTLYATFKEARQMKDVAIFLMAWFMISDAATTINSAAVLFAKTELQMSAPSLAVIGVMVVFFGIMGATLMPKYIVPRLGAANPTRGIIFVVVLASFIPLYGILGFFTSHFGLRHPWEMYVLAAWYGFALGGLNTLCRSVFSMLIPKGKETTFFSLFSVTDKGSSIFGPLITGMITDKTHNIRYTFYFLFLLMMLPIVVLSWLDVERGRREALYLENVEAVEDDVE